jgi:hypothetical protein
VQGPDHAVVAGQDARPSGRPGEQRVRLAISSEHVHLVAAA